MEHSWHHGWKEKKFHGELFLVQVNNFCCLRSFESLQAVKLLMISRFHKCASIGTVWNGKWIGQTIVNFPHLYRDFGMDKLSGQRKHRCGRRAFEPWSLVIFHDNLLNGLLCCPCKMVHCIWDLTCRNSPQHALAPTAQCRLLQSAAAYQKTRMFYTHSNQILYEGEDPALWLFKTTDYEQLTQQKKEKAELKHLCMELLGNSIEAKSTSAIWTLQRRNTSLLVPCKTAQSDPFMGACTPLTAKKTNQKQTDREPHTPH